MKTGKSGRLVAGFLALVGVIVILSCASSNSTGIQVQAVPVDASILTGNLWQKTGGDPQRYFKFFDDGFMMYLTYSTIPGDLVGRPDDVLEFEIIRYEFTWALQEGKVTYNLVNYNNKYEGYFVDENTIKGKEKGDDLVRVTDQKTIEKYNSPKYNFSPMNVLPIKKKRIPDSSASEIQLENPNDYTIAAAIVSGDAVDYRVITAGTNQSLKVPNASYEIYFVTSNEPDTLYQGDTVTVKNQRSKITFTAVSNGNYGVKKVEQ